MKPTISVLQRKIERLEAQLSALQDSHNKTFKHYTDLLWEVTDNNIRMQQAVAILTRVEE